WLEARGGRGGIPAVPRSDRRAAAQREPWQSRSRAEGRRAELVRAGDVAAVERLVGHARAGGSRHRVAAAHEARDGGLPRGSLPPPAGRGVSRRSSLGRRLDGGPARLPRRSIGNDAPGDRRDLSALGAGPDQAPVPLAEARSAGAWGVPGDLPPLP